MLVDRFYDKYKHTTAEIDIPKYDRPSKDHECDIDRLARILPSNYFDIDLFRDEPVDAAFLRRRGFVFIAFGVLSLLLSLYMLYHCHKASCADCLQNLDKFPCGSCKSVYSDYTFAARPPDKRIPHALLTYLQHSDVNTCSLTYCVFNSFWRPSTHYEKCYYSSLVFNTFIWFLAMRLVRWLADVCFRHSLPAVIPED